MLNNESMEMYLETILRLCKSNEKVRAVDIANQMRISKVSVCHANRLASMAGERQAEKLKQNFICYDTVKKDSKSVFGKLLMITTSLRQTEKAGIRVCFMSKAAPTGEIWFRSNLTLVCLIRQRKGLKTIKFITRKFMQ